MTQQEAIDLFRSGWWKTKSPREIFEFQLNEERLCMPFPEFHEAAEKVLDRPVFTHEFARPDLLRIELAGNTPAPILQNIMDLIPPEKRIIVEVSEEP